jgi:hypothetical protein
MDMNLRRDTRPSEVRDDTWRNSTDLDRNYRRIGISAVAAAARYASGAKNPAPASDEHERAG